MLWRRRKATSPAGTRPDLARSVAALDAIEQRFAATPWWEHHRIDRVHRGRTYSVPAEFPDWHRFRPADVADLALRSSRPVVAAGLLSMHPDGYVREAAVRILAETPEPAALPFLLVRAADWVAPVRDQARAAVRARLTDPAASPADLLRTLPVLERMSADAARSNTFASETLDRLRAGLATPDLVAGLHHETHQVRRCSARALVARDDVTIEILATALAQHDTVTATTLASAALRNDDAGDPDDPGEAGVLGFGEVVAALWGSRIGSLRAEALHRAQAGHAPLARSMSEEGLVDRSPGVRFLAQRWLVGQGVDVRGRYEAALPRHVIALHGLAEVAGPGEQEEVAALVATYLGDERPRARAFAVQAIGVLRGAAAQPVMLAAFDDPSPAVVRAAGQVLAGQGLGADTLDVLWDRVVATGREDVRRAAFRAFVGQGRWPRLVLACRALVAADEDLHPWGERLLAGARAGWNSSSSLPTPAQIEELDRLVPTVADRRPPADARDLLDLLDRSR